MQLSFFGKKNLFLKDSNYKIKNLSLLINRAYFILPLLIISSCEKTIDLKVQNQPAKLVVDASIENNNFPVVVLSASLNYFSSITSEELSNSFVHNAIVT